MECENKKFDRAYYKRDRLNPIRGFCATVQNSSNTTKAAKATGIEAPTIRNQIRTLEEQLGVKLFERTKNNRMLLTDAGKAFYSKAVIILQDFDGLVKNFLDDYKDAKVREIKIAAHYIVLSEILPKYLRILKSDPNYKDTKIKLINIPKQEALERLKNSNIDIAIYPVIQGEKIPIEFKVEKYFKYKDVMVLPKDNPLAIKDKIELEDFKAYPYFLMDTFSFYDPKNLIEFGESDINFENATWEMLLGLTKEKLGITGMSEKILNRYNNIGDIFVKKEIEQFFPSIFFSTFLKKDFANKKAIIFLMKEMKKDAEK